MNGFVGSADTAELVEESSWSEEFMSWSEEFMSPTMTSSSVPKVGANTSEEFKVCNASSSNYTISGETWVRFMV